jgi:hypothetical protein
MPEEPQSLREQVETLPSRKGGFVVAAILITCAAIAGAFVFVRPPAESVSATTISSAVVPARTPRLHAHEPKSTSLAITTTTATATTTTTAIPAPTTTPTQIAKAKARAKPARPKLPPLPAPDGHDAPRVEPEPPPLPDFPIPPQDPPAN